MSNKQTLPLFSVEVLLGENFQLVIRTGISPMLNGELPVLPEVVVIKCLELRDIATAAMLDALSTAAGAPVVSVSGEVPDLVKQAIDRNNWPPVIGED